MVTPKPSGHTTGRLDHPNSEEAEKMILNIAYEDDGDL